METEVIPISDAFVNEEEVVHCGILICCEHDPGHPDRPVLLVPRIRRQGRSVAASCEYDIQLGQFSVNPPRLVLEVGGTST